MWPSEANAKDAKEDAKKCRMRVVLNEVKI